MSMTINSIASSSLQRNFQQIATGQRINSAANDAAGLAISENIHSQIRGLEQATNNAANMQNLVTTAEGSAGVISDVLGRARELTVQYQNGTLNDEQRSMIQNEINELMGAANQIASTTQFNGKNLLNGQASNLNTASSPNGTGQQITIPSLTTQALQMDNFLASSSGSLEQIDNALSAVNSARANMGASINTLNSTMNSNSISQLNLAASRSRIADTNIPQAVSENKKNQLLDQYNVLMNRNKMQQEQNRISIFY